MFNKDLLCKSVKILGCGVWMFNLKYIEIISIIKMMLVIFFILEKFCIILIFLNYLCVLYCFISLFV